jgi:uncharacterized protein
MQAEFHEGIRLFNAGEFFEAHERLEQVWLADRSTHRLFLQALIHLAVGFHHARNGNPAGAERQLRKGLKKLAGYLPACAGIDTAALLNENLARLEELTGKGAIGSYPAIHLIGS